MGRRSFAAQYLALFLILFHEIAQIGVWDLSPLSYGFAQDRASRQRAIQPLVNILPLDIAITSQLGLHSSPLDSRLKPVLECTVAARR
jgi:hypothetical protein